MGKAPEVKSSLRRQIGDDKSLVVKKSARGLRKLAAKRYAETGATITELESLFGFYGGRMASLYTSGADRRRLAQQAAAKLARTSKQRLVSSRRDKNETEKL